MGHQTALERFEQQVVALASELETKDAANKLALNVLEDDLKKRTAEMAQFALEQQQQHQLEIARLKLEIVDPRHQHQQHQQPQEQQQLLAATAAEVAREKATSAQQQRIIAELNSNARCSGLRLWLAAENAAERDRATAAEEALQRQEATVAAAAAATVPTAAATPGAAAATTIEVVYQQQQQQQASQSDARFSLHSASREQLIARIQDLMRNLHFFKSHVADLERDKQVRR